MEIEANTQLKEVMLKVMKNNSYMQFLGIEMVEMKEGYGIGRMKYKDDLLNPYGMLHGGSLYSLADIVAGSVACMCGCFVTTVSGTMNFLLPAVQTEYVYCEASQLRMGRHLAVFSVRIKDDDGKILDSGEFTFFVTDQKVQ